MGLVCRNTPSRGSEIFDVVEPTSAYTPYSFINNTERKYGNIAYRNLDPTEALMLVFVNNVIPASLTRTSENTLILSSPKIYRKLLADNNWVILLRSVASVIVNTPEDKLTKSE